MVSLAKVLFTCSPILALCTVYVQGYYWGGAKLNLTLAMALFFVSLPVQVFILLGLKAKEKLPLALQAWYKEIEQKLKEENPNLTNYSRRRNKPLTYMDLAIILNDLFTKRR